MIIWVNGPFGAGKSSVAAELLHRIPEATLFDPEEVGFMLRNLLPGREPDFQDLPPWRPLVAATAIELISYTGGPLIAPMSLLREDYANWLTNTAHIIDTSHITAREAADQIATLTTSGP